MFNIHSSTNFAYLLGLISTIAFLFSIYYCAVLYKNSGVNEVKIWILNLASQFCDVFSPPVIIICSLIAVYLWHVEMRDFIPLGTYCYNVEITTSSGTYTVPAEIERVLVDVDEDNVRPEFHIRRIYWPNGGYFDFEDFNEVEIEKTHSCYANQIEDSVDIYMLDERSSHPYIVEDYNDKPYGMYNTVILGAAWAICLALVNMVSSRKAENNSMLTAEDEHLTCDDIEELETEEIEVDQLLQEYDTPAPVMDGQMSIFDVALPEPEKVKIKIKRKTK